MIATARKQIERYLSRALITQEWEVYYDCWNTKMMIPFGQLQNVDSVQYYDSNGSFTTLPEASHYWVSNTSDPGFIQKRYDAVFPELQPGRPDAIRITFTCGYGDDPEDVPENIRHAMKLLITDYFEHRGEVVVGTAATRIPQFISNLIHTYRLYQF